MPRIARILIGPVASLIDLSWSTLRFVLLLALEQRAAQKVPHDLRITAGPDAVSDARLAE